MEQGCSGPLPSAVPSARSRASVYPMGEEGIPTRSDLDAATSICDRPVVTGVLEEEDTTDLNTASFSHFFSAKKSRRFSWGKTRCADEVHLFIIGHIMYDVLCGACSVAFDFVPCRK